VGYLANHLHLSFPNLLFSNLLKDQPYSQAGYTEGRR
jgi:hypothetical protein